MSDAGPRFAERGHRLRAFTPSAPSSASDPVHLRPPPAARIATQVAAQFGLCGIAAAAPPLHVRGTRRPGANLEFN